ncbi:MAG: bifunctional glycosyltransferase family 2 protein/CDP-glycerol:glycerophosphate glycerophosphotransferase [Methanobacteriaceae archaeon]|nr:bifunctional glycosyltransferase family 2 protein/CDP-glycerol:glycerophosphate glycerophosphotransferase [Methanobacteriaceae archaeon]
MKKFKFSIIIPIFNSDFYLKKAIDSIINQTIGFKDNVQLILINDGSIDESENICREYKVKYPQNIKYINNEHNYGPSYSRNQGLKEANGKYINFLDSDDYISSNTLLNIFKFFEQHYDEVDVVSIPIHFFDKKKGSHFLNYKFKKTKVIDLVKEPSFIQLSAPSAFFKFTAINDIQFDETLYSSEDAVFVNQTLLKKQKLGVVIESTYFYRKKEPTTSLLDMSITKKDYFTIRIKKFHIQLINISLKIYEKVPRFIQHVLMYDLQWLFKVTKVDSILSSKEIKSLYSNLQYILQFIDYSVIYFQKNISNNLKAHIIFIKYLETFSLNHQKNILNKFNKNENNIKKDIVYSLSLNKIFIDIIEIKKDKIYISGIFTSFFCKDVNIFVEVNGKTIKTKSLFYPQRDNYSLNCLYGFNHNFELDIPIKPNMIISFKTDIEYLKNISLEFNRPCRLSKISRYIKSKNFICKIKNNTIIVKKNNPIRLLKTESKTIFSMISERKQGWRTGIIFRFLYFLLYPLMYSKRIWIFMDLPYLADDNGIQLFKYAVKQDDNIEKVFVLNKDNFAYKEVNKIGKVVPYGSIRHRMITLFAEKIISSHPDNSLIYPFWGNYPHLAGLLKSKTIFLQHGITKDNVSAWLKRYDKNVDLLVTASNEEYDSFFKFPYNYDKDAVKLLGFPRYDYLKKENDKKEIVIMPSWRKKLHYKTKEEILKSEYFNAYNKLINDKRLMDLCKKSGYKLIFKPHPNVNRFIDLFESNDYIEIDSKRKYNDIFNHSSLIITDYSSIAFDFAYLKKPVIYFHYSDDYHFDLNESYFKYESMGFGEIAYNQTELLNLINSYINNSCKMKKVFQNRVDDYFVFKDKKNCERVFNAIKEMDIE